MHAGSTAVLTCRYGRGSVQRNAWQGGSSALSSPPTTTLISVIPVTQDLSEMPDPGAWAALLLVPGPR